jgi:Transposase IS116/IS110/IS902 family/Fructose-bisphosphate aldolase class-II
MLASLLLGHLVRAALEAWPHLPVGMHQVHGNNLQTCKQAIDLGLSSVMMDGSLEKEGRTPPPTNTTLAGELAVAPELCAIFEALVVAVRDPAKGPGAGRRGARRSATARRFMSAPGAGPITALAVAAAFDDAGRFCSSASASDYLGLTPRHYKSGEISRNGRISGRGDRMTRTHLYEAANPIMTRKTAHTTSIRPTLNANMRRSRSDRGEIPDPGQTITGT